MADIDLGSLLAAAAADLRPAAFVREEIPAGDSPAEQAAAGYVMAVNLVLRAAEMDCEDAWQGRQKIYAAEIARLQTEGGNVDPVVIDQLNSQRDRGELNDRYRAHLSAIAQAGYERVFELMAALRTDVRHLARTEILKRVGATVEEVNALTQRLIDEDRPGGTVQEFLAARHLDTSVPPY